MLTVKLIFKTIFCITFANKKNKTNDNSFMNSHNSFFLIDSTLNSTVQIINHNNSKALCYYDLTWGMLHFTNNCIPVFGH